ncbi:sensor histidine kinase [Chryseobacterium jejuense]|uniref:sensor histidine kinase n=1 Tax=Chryseobacterium jejuense TaxID=445960 RepID=UPI001AE62B17|nr:histidine kinase [Chryseobacterium jejuense]
MIRIYVEAHFIAQLYSGKSFFNASIAHISYVVVTNFVALVLAVLLKHVSISFVIMKKQKEMERKQLMTEMKLLKAQLQPHFLFNSLNNIYYEAYKESPKAAQLIEKLSEVMRFFLEINMKDKIPVETEISFIRNIIDLEQIRCYNPVHVEINNNVGSGVYIPPMLMVPLVENALKHGIDKRSSNNYILIDIQVTANNISFSIRNHLHTTIRERNISGTGLKNLKERLILLYTDNYTLQTFEQESDFIANLNIPRK